MAFVTLTRDSRTLNDVAEIKECLRSCGVDYERWTLSTTLAEDAPPDEVLLAYSREIEELKAKGGYVTADVIDVTPQHLASMQCLRSSIGNTGTMKTKFDSRS